MKIVDFDWDEGNIEHIALHHVSPDEVEYVCKHKPYTLKGRMQRYLIYGRTQAGRYLFVVAKYQSRGMIRVITSREMTWREKRFYQEYCLI